MQAYEDLHGVQVAISRQTPDLLLLEVQLPDGDGFNYLKKLKQSFSFPVIFVTGRVAESDRILGSSWALMIMSASRSFEGVGAQGACPVSEDRRQCFGVP